MRNISVKEITKQVKEMCIEANHFLTDDMKSGLENALLREESKVGKNVLEQLQQNLEIASTDFIPICQDTGMAVIFIEIGQEVHFVDGNLEEAINEGYRYWGGIHCKRFKGYTIHSKKSKGDAL